VSNTYWGSKGELREVVALAERGKIQVHAERFSLDETGKAYELLAAGSVRGRAIAVPHG
jgi:propanol-preferring alcohol dehydrogenase